ncbi:MAG: hypothetical protein EOS72_20570 [Mesorhizobium sp.]|uniref:carbamoyltransferase C-terminal domain-containing protein n=1 Tax=Mesorhizobium sp. TaxID=1871066 RepID=UPI000FE590E0|nr:carbamoyltransferase C-terminal domain-containing protein [Mesorhizobium sp.]RWC87642.1 MAG: hypothetical protein EOS72_20570 [Mesorhizobium sp.]
MVLLGLNSGFDYLGRPVDNGASVLLADGKIIAAIAEERLSREKYAGGFALSASRVLEIGGVRECDIDRVAVSLYQHPDVPNRISTERLRHELPHRFHGREIIIRSHHRSHAASAFYQSPFERALVCVWDNEGSVIGEWEPAHFRRSERHSYYLGEGNELSLVSRELDGPDDVGFGQGYARFTRFVGLGSYRSAGKLMGLSAYGDPQRYAMLGPLWPVAETGQLRSSMRIRDKQLSVPLLFARQGLAAPAPGDDHGHDRQEMRDLAAYVQHQLESAAIRRLRGLLEQTGASAICVAGGVGLNSVLNSKLQRELGVPVYVPPHPDDTGQAMGNVLLTHISEAASGAVHRWNLTNDMGGNYVGSDFSDCAGRVKFSSQATTTENVVEDAADEIASGAIVGWFQGRSEYGARALGHRSILADPRSAGMTARINKIKGREPFRPVAPAVTSESASQYFDIEASPLWATMSGTAAVRSRAAGSIAGAVHVDGTARPQVVEPGRRPLFHALLRAFEKRTAVPVLLNTSFNSASEPIVETPEQACASADRMGLDILYLSNLRFDLRRMRV